MDGAAPKCPDQARQQTDALGSLGGEQQRQKRIANNEVGIGDDGETLAFGAAGALRDLTNGIGSARAAAVVGEGGQPDGAVQRRPKAPRRKSKRLPRAFSGASLCPCQLLDPDALAEAPLAAFCSLLGAYFVQSYWRNSFQS